MKWSVLLCLVTALVSVQGKTRERDVEALLLFKREVIRRDRYWRGIMKSWSGGGPNGEDDPCANGWKSDWEGVECRFQGSLDPDVPRVVTNIHVTDSNVTGPVPMAISLLRDLIEIDMDGNKITGPLNPYIGCLSQLVEIDLANNSLTGDIPTEWRFLTRLEEVELEVNPGLTGCIPRGMPPEETVCNDGPQRGRGPRCFLIGTIVFDTAVTGFCPDEPALVQRCPDVAFVEQFIEEGMPYDLYYQSEAPSRGRAAVEVVEPSPSVVRDDGPLATASRAASPVGIADGDDDDDGTDRRFRRSSFFDILFG